MLRTLRNFTINIIAAFICDKEARHKFRNRYKKKSKFRKLRDDNKLILERLNNLSNHLKILETDIKRLKKFSLSSSLLWPLEDTFDDYISIVCIAKDEGPYVKEWLEYHKIIGVDRFYFYDNGSSDNTKDVLEPYINNGTVIYKYIPGKRLQIPVYQDAILKAKNKTKWLAIIDLDEFIVPTEKDNIKDFLVDYESYPGVGINIVLFDSNGHITKPIEHEGLVTANYTRVSKDYTCHIDSDAVYTKDLGLLIKSIVNPRMVIDIVNPHYAIYRFGKLAVTENFKPISFQYKTDFHSHSKIQLNHYVIKSREEYIIRRTTKLTADSATKYKLDEKLINFEQETTYDNKIQKYLPKLYRAIQSDNDSLTRV